MPRWLGTGPTDVWREQEGGSGWVLASGVPVAPATRSQPTTVRGTGLARHDMDRDGIPDAYDILLGAKKVAANAAEYRSNYLALAYPGGDVPRTEGVCTDVVVRALRNAGIDLQKEIHEDAQAHPERYPEIRRRDANIDHRRVKNVLPWFTQHWQNLGANYERAVEPWLPGDIVFFDTLPAKGPDHLGIVSDETGPSGLPLVINNWTEGYRESAMDLLPQVTVTHRFRIKSAAIPGAPEAAGLSGLLGRHQLQLPAEAQQAVLVLARLWDRSVATLQRFERSSTGAPFMPAGEAWTVRLGTNGLGRGVGLHAEGSLSVPSTKAEGDRRSPAGLFALGTAFGREPPPAGVRWPYRQTKVGDVFVDDPRSKYYNQWRVETAKPEWESREDLMQYQLGIVVEHNHERVPGKGSAIFIHELTSSRPTAGCTGLTLANSEELLRWLSPDKHPVLVQLAGTLYAPG
jgi:uncharacterized protein YijF (DUF1287 family)